MRVLIVSFRFPPQNSSGSLRVGKTAQLLQDSGVDVRVLTPADPPLSNDLDLGFEEQHIVRTRWRNVNRIPELLSGGSEKVRTEGYSRETSLRRRAEILWRNVVNMPDLAVGWLPYAIREGTAFAKHWQPDVILGSFGPPSSLIAASRIAANTGIPWVAEFRDLWRDNPYNNFYQPWRARIDWVMERRIVSTATALVTVSEPLAEELTRLHGKRCLVVRSGFDEEDLPPAAAPPPGPVTIRHMGTIYPGLRDPSPLFRVLRDDRALASQIRVEFYGRNLGDLEQLVDRYQVHDHVFVGPQVTRQESLRLQANADVLLLLMRGGETDRGTLPGKFFEYLGCSRPILQIGGQGGVSAQAIEQRHLGWAPPDDSALHSALVEMSSQKAAGVIPAPASQSRDEFSRSHQVAQLKALLQEVAAAR